jgi:hypothetical protein
MRLNKTERESLRKRVKILIPQMKKSEIVNHFQKEGYPRRTIYNIINRFHNGESIKDKKQTGRPTSWTTTRKNKNRQTVAWMDENVKFVPKDINPPNVPQARLIENFWVFLAQKVYEGGWKAKTEQQLIRRINSKMKKFDKNFVESLLEGVKAKVKSIGDNGVYFLFK